jgi:hypothetical protein
MMTTTTMKMKTKTTIMSNLIPGMRTMKMKTMAADVAMRMKAIMTAVTASRGVRVSNATAADNTKAGAKVAAKAGPAPARAREDARPPAVAEASLQWTATRSGASPAKAAGLIMNIGVETGMMKEAVAARAADHPATAALRAVPPAVAVLRAVPLVAAERVPLPGAAIQALQGMATRDNNAMPADNSPAGAAVRVTAAGPIPVTVIATAATIAAAAATAVTANHS